MKKARGFFKNIINLVKKPEMRILPGQLAFFIVMSLVPIIALIGAIASSLSLSPDSFLSLDNSIPIEIASLIKEVIGNQDLNFNIIIFFVSAFILASNGTHSMIITSNEIYKIPPKDILSRRLKAIIMIFLMIILFFILFLIPVFGDNLFALLKLLMKDDIAIEFFYNMFKVLKYPLVISLLYIIIKLIYVIAPDKQIPSNTTTKGSLFTTIGWIIATEIYSFYIKRFSSYSLFYGSISNLLILLIWIYILSYIFVLGMGINASIYEDSKTKIEI